MASTKNTKLTNAKSQLDAKYGSWAGNYVEKMLKSWKTLEDVKKSLSNYKGGTNYTPYTSLTWKTPTQNTNPGWTGRDLSYVKASDYYWSWIDWDYWADISKDNNRAKQMAYNLKADMKANPGLFRNRADFDQYYNYKNRSASQKKMLDEFFDNANKYWLGSTDNFYADMASQASTDKNRKLLAKDADTYNKMLPIIDGIKNKLNERLGPVFDKLMDSQTKYLQDMAYLRKLQMQYNRGMVEEANSRAAWQSASLWTMMSWQWLSQSSIASSMMGAEKNWVAELNNIQKQHIDTMKSLADAEWEFNNNRAGIINNLTWTEQTYLKDWYDAFKWLQDWLDNSYKTLIKEQYSPYEVLTQAKVTGWADTLTSAGKSDIKASEYQSWDNGKRSRILYNNLSAVLWSSPETLAKLSTYITSAAAQYSDFQTALNSILSKAWVSSSNAQRVVNKIMQNQENENQNENENEETSFDFSNISTNFLNNYK